MKTSSTFTSSINSVVLKKLHDYADKHKTPKNRIIETALQRYFEDAKRAEYIRSFRRAKADPEMSQMAEEGLEDFLKILD
jgi:hypothetical protein